uniref:Uncharacterized protein n=1 Tax=Anguilla anguilla TaxID=7936 RepID=A0A0E9WUV0_ANGAN
MTHLCMSVSHKINGAAAFTAPNSEHYRYLIPRHPSIHCESTAGCLGRSTTCNLRLAYHL